MCLCACVRVCKAVNLPCPAPSKKTDSPLRRMLQRKITTPTDKHTLVSAQTHTARHRKEVLHLNWSYSLLFILNVLFLWRTVYWVLVIVVHSKYWLVLHWTGDRLSLRGRVKESKFSWEGIYYPYILSLCLSWCCEWVKRVLSSHVRPWSPAVCLAQSNV